MLCSKRLISWTSLVHVYHLFSNCLFVNGHLACVCVPVVAGNAATGTGVQISLPETDVHSFGQISGCGIARSYSSSVFRVFHWLYHFTFPLTVYNGFFFSTSSPIIYFLLRTTFLTSVRWYRVVLICIPLTTSDVECFYKYLLPICMSSLEKCLCRSFVYFLMGFFALFAIEL